jgi:hypothetical protein
MASNHVSLSDPYVTTPRAELRGTVRTGARDSDATRRTVMVGGGFVLALISLIIGSIALVQVFLAPAAATVAAPGGPAPASGLQSWEALAMIVFGGVGFAAGAALVGIGMGHWTSPRPPQSDTDYTGPGDAEDMPDEPRVV